MPLKYTSDVPPVSISASIFSAAISLRAFSIRARRSSAVIGCTPSRIGFRAASDGGRFASNCSAEANSGRAVLATVLPTAAPAAIGPSFRKARRFNMAAILSTRHKVAGAAWVLVILGFAVHAQVGDWPAYGRDAGGERFSPLDLIR